jgi:hypothetical protein
MSASNPATPAVAPRPRLSRMTSDGSDSVGFGSRIVRQELMLARSASADRCRGGEFSSDDDEESGIQRLGGGQYRGKWS